MAGIPGFEKVFDLPELDVQELVDAFACVRGRVRWIVLP